MRLGALIEDQGGWIHVEPGRWELTIVFDLDDQGHALMVGPAGRGQHFVCDAACWLQDVGDGRVEWVRSVHIQGKEISVQDPVVCATIDEAKRACANDVEEAARRKTDSGRW